MSESEHLAADVKTIVVDPDDVVEMMRRNDRDDTEQRTHCLRVSPPFDDELRATPHVSEDGSHYPLEMSPKPIHLGPTTFLAGVNHPGKQMPSTCRYPSRNDSRSRFRDEFDVYDEHGETRDLTGEEQAEWEDWWGHEIEFWENEVRSHLHDETRLVSGHRQGPETIVEIRYESNDE